MPDTLVKTDRPTRILDAAEALFARHGFDGVTLRAIAKAADVDVALANYHFGPKADLFATVVNRRAGMINDMRLRALDRAWAEAAPATPTIEAIMRAYLEPILIGAHVNEPGWRSYYALVAYVNNSTEWGGRLMADSFDPMVRRFVQALRDAAPEADDHALYWGYHCLSGALTLAFAQTGRLDRLSDGVCRSTALQDACEHLVKFCTGGFEAVLKR